MVENDDNNWCKLCREASKEQDPRKLIDLLREINQALTEQRARTAELGHA